MNNKDNLILGSAITNSENSTVLQLNNIPNIHLNTGSDTTSTFNSAASGKILLNLLNIQHKEDLLFDALRSFVKKNNFHDLNEMLINDEISEDEFNTELNTNEFKYIIDHFKTPNQIELQLIIEIVNKIGLNLRDFTESEITEMFSLDPNSFSNLLNYKSNFLP